MKQSDNPSIIIRQKNSHSTISKALNFFVKSSNLKKSREIKASFCRNLFFPGNQRFWEIKLTFRFSPNFTQKSAKWTFSVIFQWKTQKIFRENTFHSCFSYFTELFYFCFSSKFDLRKNRDIFVIVYKMLSRITNRWDIFEARMNFWI